MSSQCCLGMSSFSCSITTLMVLGYKGVPIHHSCPKEEMVGSQDLCMGMVTILKLFICFRQKKKKKKNPSQLGTTYCLVPDRVDSISQVNRTKTLCIVYIKSKSNCVPCILFAKSGNQCFWRERLPIASHSWNKK